MHAMFSTWPEHLGQFFRMFAKPGDRLGAGHWPQDSVTDILPFAGPACKCAHDAYHLFFSDARWAISQLWKTLTLILVACFCPADIISLVLDDTLSHQSGIKMDGVGYACRKSLSLTHEGLDDA